MFGFVLGSLHEDGREGVDSIQLIVWRSSSVGFPSRGGKVSYASLKRQAIASGVIVFGFSCELGEVGIYSRTRDVVFLARGAGRVQ
jgi:hypothetical protein